MDGSRIRSGLSPSALIILAGLVVLSGGAFLIGAVADVQRTWANLLVASYGLLGFGLGSAIFLALLFVTGARWSDRIRPIVENLTFLLPAGAVGVLLVLIACPSLYPWTAGHDEEASRFQQFWLSRRFFLLRAVVYLTLWCVLALLLLRASRRHTLDPNPSRTRAVRLSALFLVAFGLTGWLASMDWIMSLEPKWSSAVFGVYNFAGMFLGAIAALVVLVVCLDRRGAAAAPIDRHQLGDLGTLLFSFSSFWMYLWFCQYLLIWYVNNPEEADYYILRQQERGPWLFLGNVLLNWEFLFLANVTLNWGVPFVVLLFRPAKESPLILTTVALLVLAGRWVDVYTMVLPPVAGHSMVFGFWDACLMPGTIGLAVLLAGWRVPRPAGDMP